MADQPFKILPHNEEAERAALGAMFVDDDSIATVLQFLRPDDFYSGANRCICEAIYKVSAEGRKADLITITGELQKAGRVDQAGGLDYIASLTHVVPSSANVEYYAQVVQDCALRRALIKAAVNISAEAYNETNDARLLLDQTQQTLFELYDLRETAGVKSAGEIVSDTKDYIFNIYKNKSAYSGVPSGFEYLDSITRGFQPAELIIIGARPGMGKTALALSMASHITIKKNIPAAFFSLEMSDQSLMIRLISSETRIDSEKLRTGLLAKTDLRDIWDAAGRIAEAPLYIVDMPNMRFNDLRAQARRFRSRQKVEIIFIDYMSLIVPDNIRYAQARWEQMAEISRSLKALARQLNIPIVVLSQLNRDIEKKNAKPNLSSIRESGAIEQDADLIMFIHGERETDKSIEEQEAKLEQQVDLIIEKHRNGRVGTIKLNFLKPFNKFVTFEGDRYDKYGSQS